MLYTNRNNIPLAVSLFLATDNYEGGEEGSISVTTLLKPVRQLVLAARVPEELKEVDINEVIQSRIGSAIHDAIERSWASESRKKALIALRFPEEVADRIKVNPDPLQLDDDDIPVYLEQRSNKEIMGRIVTGKYDLVAEGRVEDIKSTTVYVYMNNTKDEDFIMQGSMYRWLNPQIITRDEMAINFILMDWNAGQAAVGKDKGYPQQRIIQKILPLQSIQQTEAFVRQKLILIERYKDAADEDIPLCTDSELWRSEPQYKYYKNPQKTERSTKNFDTYQEAHQRWLEDGQVGLIKTVPGKVVACKYCPAFSVCKQKDALILSGDLVL